MIDTEKLMHHVACCIAAALAVISSTRLEAETLSFESVVSPSERTATRTGTLSLPPGNGPFPVVVLLHPVAALTCLESQPLKHTLGTCKLPALARSSSIVSGREIWGEERLVAWKRLAFGETMPLMR